MSRFLTRSDKNPHHVCLNLLNVFRLRRRIGSDCTIHEATTMTLISCTFTGLCLQKGSFFHYVAQIKLNLSHHGKLMQT